MKIIVAAACLLLAGCGPPAAEKQKAAAPVPARVRITQFYAGEATIPKGGRTLLCYGVENAKSVRLQPPVETLSPSLNRCFEVRPAAATTYTLSAEGEDGSVATASFTVSVSAKAAEPPPAAKSAAGGPLITRFSQEKKPGVVLLCYEADGAEAVSIEPAALARTAAVRGCYGVAPRQPTTYTLTAYGPHGRTERRTLKVEPVQ